jgi:zinc transport system substrate-binding protein
MLRRTFLAALAAFPLVASALPALAADQPLGVTVSILPLESMVKAIGGDHVAVTVMVPPGTAPATFEPSPAQMAALETSALYVAMGIPQEKNWMSQVRAARPDMPVLTLSERVETRKITGKGANAGKEIADPHIWLGPAQLRAMAAALRDELVRIDPAHEVDYTAGAQAWLARLDAADAAARARLAPHAGKAFLVFHPVFGYLGDAYGLRQIAIEQQGMEPGPKMIAAAIDAARAEGIKVIFVQPEFSDDEAKAVAAEIGGKVVKLDPLAPDPIDTIGKIADAFAAAFQ